MWELINEPRPAPPKPKAAVEGPAKQAFYAATRKHADSFHAWAAAMSRLLKKECGIKQMVAVGDEGFFFRKDANAPAYDGTYGVDWEKDLRIPTIDVAGCHMYPEHWSWPAGQCRQWIADHAEVARKVGKPLIVGEWGLADYTPRHGETPEHARRRRQDARDAADTYRKSRGTHPTQFAAADADWRAMHPAFPAGQAAQEAGVPGPARTPHERRRRLELYRDWIAAIEQHGAGWLLWQVVGPDNSDRPVWPPDGCDWISLRLGCPADEAFLDRIGPAAARGAPSQ